MRLLALALVDSWILVLCASGMLWTSKEDYYARAELCAAVDRELGAAGEE